MKRILLLIISSVIICACGSSPIPVNELARINKDFTIEKAKVAFEDYTDTSVVSSKVVNGKTYSLFYFIRETTKKSIWNFAPVGNNAGYGNNGYNNGSNYGAGSGGYNNSYNNSNQRLSSTTYANFYIIFEGDKLFFSGFRYEAIIHPNKEILSGLFDFEETEMIHETRN